MLLINELEGLKNSSKTAVIICDKDKIIERKSYKDIVLASKKITEIFKRYIKTDNSTCIGLLMEKNIFQLSIILSVQECNHAFAHLPRKNYIKIAENLNMKYVLSVGIDAINSYEKIIEIQLDENNIFTFWKTTQCSPEMCFFNGIFCVMQSSGTTGTSKIIRIPYDCIYKNAVNLGKIFSINSEDLISWGTPLSFDPSLIELLLALLNGATLVLVPQEIFVYPKELYLALFSVANISVLQIVPSIFQRWNDDMIKQILSSEKLRILAFGGEVFPHRILQFKIRNGLKLFNLYGITELSCWATFHEVQSIDDEVPIGIPLEDTIIKLIDENGRDNDEGVGEIYIGSESRRCYVDNETHSNESIFRKTGDLGYKKNSKIFYKGRKHRVIKRYGHKIDLANIDETIFNHCDLTSRTVWSQKNKLLTYIHMQESYPQAVKAKILDKIRIKLLHILPDYSFPDHFEILNNFPVTSHGKIDDRKLEEIFNLNNTNDATAIFCSLWSKYAGVSSHKSESFQNYNFFEMGGNSIGVLQLISEFKESTNIDSEELIVNIFEKKYSDCINIIERISSDLCTSIRQKTVLDNLLHLKLPVMNICWKYDLKACVDATPLIFTINDSVRISVGSFGNIFTILDENSKEIYKDVLAGSIEGTPMLSPCKKFIYIGSFDGTMYCIDINKNKIIWTVTTGDKIKSSPINVLNTFRIVFGSYDKYVYCVSSLDGELIWKTQLNGSIAANLIFNKFGIFATTLRGNCYCISESGNICWNVNCNTSIFGTPCVLTEYDQIVVPTVSGILWSLCLRTGSTCWKYQAGGYIFSSLITVENYCLFGCHDKNIYIIKIIDANNCELYKKIELNSEISTTPCVYKENNFVGIIAACNMGIISLIDYKSFNVIKKTVLPTEVFSSPVAHKNKLYVGCRDNNLYCLLLK